MTEAFASVQYITTEVGFGLVNSISSLRVSKYDVFNDDFACISCFNLQEVTKNSS